MKTKLLIFAVSLLPCLSNAQNKHILSINKMLDIRGTNGKNLVITDDESMRVEHLFSEHYVDSVTGIPYTGLITIDYNGNAIDSLHTVNGYKEGTCLYYHTRDSIRKSRLEYYDQEKGILITRSFPYSQKSKYNYLSLRFFSEEVSIRLSCKKKKQYWFVEIYEDAQKSTCKINSIEEFKNIIRSYKTDVNLVEMLREMNVLDKL
jgi:hypothetical protein